MEKVIVAGSGISGTGSAELLLSHDVNVLLFDENKDKDEYVIRKNILSRAAGKDGLLEVCVGELPEKKAKGAAYCVMSPGINPRNTEFVKVLDKLGIPYISEIELAYKYGRGRIAAITGTNGKTTTTALLGQIVADAGLDTYVVGNIGKAYTGVADQLKDESVAVIEVAGFHLETIDKFRPDVSAILNITPDHLDRFGTMDAYAASKYRIAENQTESDICVLNYEDDRLLELSKHIKPRVLFFSSERELEEGAFLRNEKIIIRLDGKESILCRIYDMKLLGKHNYENIMAAALMALSLGIPIASIKKSVLSFKAVEHRIEFVAEIGGVTYYNDSKGTNPDAAVQAIKAMNRPTILIAGGYDKHIEFDNWIKECIGRVRQMVLIGESARQIADTCEKYGFTSYVMADSFEEAFEKAKNAARSGETVLLSPACASWDMFPNYEVRGKIFKDLVLK